MSSETNVSWSGPKIKVSAKSGPRHQKGLRSTVLKDLRERWSTGMAILRFYTLSLFFLCGLANISARLSLICDLWSSKHLLIFTRACVLKLGCVKGSQGGCKYDSYVLLKNIRCIVFVIRINLANYYCTTNAIIKTKSTVQWTKMGTS